MKRVITGVIILILTSASAAAQDSTQHTGSLFHGGKLIFKPGIGLGLDFGGIGIKGEFLPSQWLGIFGGLGYNFINAGWNTGFSFKLMPRKKVTPVILAMYGYNAGLKVKEVSASVNNDVLKKTYYGLTLGAGVEAGFGKNSRATFAILIPFRSKEFTDTYNNFKDRGYTFNPPILPITLSIGCMF